eukprot:2858418-Amphidinium_carterae.1
MLLWPKPNKIDIQNYSVYSQYSKSGQKRTWQFELDKRHIVSSGKRTLFVCELSWDAGKTILVILSKPSSIRPDGKTGKSKIDIPDFGAVSPNASVLPQSSYGSTMRSVFERMGSVSKSSHKSLYTVLTGEDTD